MVQLHPDRFPGFVASLAMNNPEAALAEAERATLELGAVGVQVFTNVNGQPLDQPAFLQLFEAMGRAAETDLASSRACYEPARLPGRRSIKVRPLVGAGMAL